MSGLVTGLQNQLQRFESATDLYYGAIAQLVEQRTENPCVTGSIPVGTTYIIFFWSLSSVGSERLPYKQRVGGSNPSATTKIKNRFERFPSIFHILK